MVCFSNSFSLEIPEISLGIDSNILQRLLQKHKENHSKISPDDSLGTYARVSPKITHLELFPVFFFFFCEMCQKHVLDFLILNKLVSFLNFLQNYSINVHIYSARISTDMHTKSQILLNFSKYFS